MWRDKAQLNGYSGLTVTDTGGDDAETRCSELI